MANRIENEFQRGVTLVWIDKFQLSVDEAQARIDAASDDAEKRMGKLVLDGYKSQLDDLKEQVKDYDRSKALGKDGIPPIAQPRLPEYVEDTLSE